MALGVDAIAAARSVVVQSVPEHAAALPTVSGATFNDAGKVELVLAPAGLVRAAQEASRTPHAAAPPPLRPLLIIDDSLTTRMLEQSILESAGYRVDLAVSGEDALEKARNKEYGLFIVDVEMPGISGFEFIQTTKEDPVLRDIPSILVTSRAHPEDKRRGNEVGARAYIVKSEFDQAQLLEVIRELLG